MSERRRILLKLSGERLAGANGFGIDPDTVIGIADEIRAHLEEKVDDLMQEGLSREDAEARDAEARAEMSRQ